MKKVMTLVKLTFIALSLSIIIGVAPTQTKVSAWVDDPVEPACPSTSCESSMVFWCNCPVSGCGGCYINDGDHGCGVCSKGPKESGDTPAWFSF
ncbi:MAG: hypothetical protein ACR2N3_02255 [Pyrinomonadaceae bacterium]